MTSDQGFFKGLYWIGIWKWKMWLKWISISPGNAVGMMGILDCNGIFYLWWYCSWFAIGLVYRQPIVENSLKISLKISWQSLWQSILPHLLPQKMIVRISLKFRQRFRYFNSSLTKFDRIVWRNFDDFFCGKMLWQNVLPQSTRRKVWRNENERNNEENPYTRTYCKW